MTREEYTEQHLDEAIARLPRDIMPEHELWSRLEQRLPERGETAATAHGGRSRYRWAAVLVLGLAGLLGWRLLLLPATQSPDPSIVTRQPVEQEAGWMAGVGQISEPFDHWQRNLAVWDEAIARVNTGLEYYPDEPVLLAQRESLYEQQRSYLQLVSAVETSYY